MDGSSFKDRHFIAKELLKLNNAINACVVRLNIFILFVVIKYFFMCNISNLSIELKSTEKTYTFPFKDTSLDSVARNSLDMLLRMNRVGKFKFSLSALTLQISFPLTTKYYQHCNAN